MSNSLPPRIRWIPRPGSSLKAPWADFVAYRRGRVASDAPKLVPDEISTLAVQIASNFEGQRSGSSGQRSAGRHGKPWETWGKQGENDENRWESIEMWILRRRGAYNLELQDITGL